MANVQFNLIRNGSSSWISTPSLQWNYTTLIADSCYVCYFVLPNYYNDSQWTIEHTLLQSNSIWNANWWRHSTLTHIPNGQMINVNIRTFIKWYWFSRNLHEKYSGFEFNGLFISNFATALMIGVIDMKNFIQLVFFATN